MLPIDSDVEKLPWSGCWIWMRGLSSTGYGDVNREGKHQPAHRYVFSKLRGAIPEGKHVCHSCDVRECVNPEHLFLGTNTENILDSVRKGRRKGITRRRPTFPNGYKAQSEDTKARRRKLNHLQAAEIYRRYEAGGISLRNLASLYGVNNVTIWNLIRRLRSSASS